MLQQDRAQAQTEYERDQARLNQVKIVAPMSGLVAIRQQRTNFFFAGSEVPDIREGGVNRVTQKLMEDPIRYAEGILGRLGPAQVRTLKRHDEGYLFTASGENAFIFARLFMALERE